MARKGTQGAAATKARRAWYGNVTSNVVASLIVAALGAIGTFAMGWLRVEQSPEGIRVVRGEALGGSAPASGAPTHEIRLISEGDAPETVRLAAEIESLVRQRLRTPPAMEGLAVRYRLANLAFAGGATRRASASWAIGLPGKPGAACPVRELSFYSTPNLAERLAEQINASVAATAQQGGPTCG